MTVATSAAAVRGIERASPALLRALARAAAELRLPLDALVATIAVETAGTWRANIRNPASGATGLIQWLPSTARAQGTTVEALARMTPVQQVPWVAAYFRRWQGKLRTASDVYLAVFSPKYIGAEPDVIMYRRGQPAYDQNAHLDTDVDGVITVAEATAPVRAMLALASERERVTIPPVMSPLLLLAVGRTLWSILK
jgi:hypothetical protein